MKVCPNCGSDDVEEQLVGWYRANGDEKLTSDLAVPTLYNENHWCNECEDHVPHLVERVTPCESETAHIRASQA